MSVLWCRNGELYFESRLHPLAARALGNLENSKLESCQYTQTSFVYKVQSVRRLWLEMGAPMVKSGRPCLDKVDTYSLFLNQVAREFNVTASDVKNNEKVFVKVCA